MSAPRIIIREAIPTDRESLITLAPRLSVGIAPWIDPQDWLQATIRWIDNDLSQLGNKVMMFIAEMVPEGLVGFASISRAKNFRGDPQAYLGELVIAEQLEGQGIGHMLLDQAEQWAREQGMTFVALDTGSANHHAQDFYRQHGYQEDSVRLVKALT